jgi:hypothetical protein
VARFDLLLIVVGLAIAGALLTVTTQRSRWMDRGLWALFCTMVGMLVLVVLESE